MSFHWSDEGSKSYFSMAKEAILDWAAENSDILQRRGEKTKYAAVGTGVARANGETNSAKNAGYTARILSPIYAGIFGANGVWEPGHDVTGPISGWATGEGLTYLGNRKIHKKKLQEAKRTRDWFERSTHTDPTHFLMDMAKGYKPDAGLELVAKYVPLAEIIDQREGAKEILKEPTDEPRTH